MSSKMAVKVEMLHGDNIQSGCHLSFSKIAVYFKLNYFKLIRLQAKMLSSFIFTYFAVNQTNLPQKLSFGLRIHNI